MPIRFTEYGEESDPGPYPVPPNAPVEGAGEEGDRHVLVLQEAAASCMSCTPRAATELDGKPARAPSSTCAQTRCAPNGWTSADAAGLPIFPLLVRYPEVRAGQIDHALRVTVEHTQRGYIHPATHFASSKLGPEPAADGPAAAAEGRASASLASTASRWWCCGR